MRILITGGGGFLGAHLVTRCLQIPNAVLTVLDLLEEEAAIFPANLRAFWDRIAYMQGSVCDSRLLKELIPHQDIVFHCAAQTSHIFSIENPTRDAEINAEGTLKLLETLRYFNPNAILIYPSTTSVIGKPQQAIVDESHPLNPLDPYSIHKALSERYCLSYAKFQGIRMTVLRFGNLYGTYGRKEPEYNFINHFIHRALENESLQIFGSGEQKRNVMHVEDATDLMVRTAFEPSLHGTFWFATSPYHFSVREIAEKIIGVFQSGRLQHVEWSAERQRIEVGSVAFSAAALESKLGPIGATSLEEGLRKTCEAYKNLFDSTRL